MEANQELNNLYQNSNSVFYFLIRMKNEGKNVEGGRCLKGRDGRSGFIEEDREKIGKEHMEKIMNEQNEWDHMVETDVVEGPVENVARNEIVEAMQRMKPGKATGPSKVGVEMIVASGKIGVAPARWRRAESVRFAVGRPWVHSLSRFIPKDFKKWYLQLPC